MALYACPESEERDRRRLKESFWAYPPARR